MLRKLCGTAGLEKVLIATSLWSEVSREDGRSLELNLMSSDLHFKPACDKGANFERWDGTKRCTQDIVQLLANTCSGSFSPRTTLIKPLAPVSEPIPAHESQSAKSDDSQRTVCSIETQGCNGYVGAVEKQQCYEPKTQDSQEFTKLLVEQPGHSTQGPNSQNDTRLPNCDTLLQILDDGASDYCPVRLGSVFVVCVPISLKFLPGLLRTAFLRRSSAVPDGLSHHAGPRTPMYRILPVLQYRLSGISDMYMHNDR